MVRPQDISTFRFIPGFTLPEVIPCLTSPDAIVFCDSSPLKVLHLNHSDIIGGAARAAYRIHHALRNSGIDSQMLVNLATSGDKTVHGPNRKLAKAIARIRPHLVTPLCQMLRTSNPINHSPALLPSRWPEHLNASNADLVHLHWVQREMLSIADIARIRKPIVWTLHDMWAFSGAEHLAWDSRWRDGYRRDNRPDHESGFDLNRNTWQRKLRHWRKPIQIVCPSQWMADCVRASNLMHDWPATVIPNSIDTDRWQPIDQRLARQLMCLPEEGPLLLFGAMGGGNNPHKGIDLLIAAISKLRVMPNLKNLQLVVFGQLPPQSAPQLGFPVNYMGYLHDDLSLRALYSAADAFVIPSRQDNLPNTGLEAHACGTPVVAFDIGGLSSIVEHKRTGYLANSFDICDLSYGIQWIFENNSDGSLGQRARKRAVNSFSYPLISKRYGKLYQEVIALSQSK